MPKMYIAKMDDFPECPFNITEYEYIAVDIPVVSYTGYITNFPGADEYLSDYFPESWGDGRRWAGFISLRENQSITAMTDFIVIWYSKNSSIGLNYYVYTNSVSGDNGSTIYTHPWTILYSLGNKAYGFVAWNSRDSQWGAMLFKTNGAFPSNPEYATEIYDFVEAINNIAKFDFKSWLMGFALGLTGKPLPMTPKEKPAPVMAPRDSWYKGGAITLKSVHLVDTYAPTGEETKSWAADEGETGAIMCYVKGEELYIAGNGSGRIKANSDCTHMFNIKMYGSEFTEITGLDLLDTSDVTSMYWMFNGCKGLQSIDIHNWDTSNVTNMGSMFYDCESLTSIDMHGLDTKNVTDMSWMFQGCEKLTSIDVRNLNTGNVTDMAAMFATCRNLPTLDLSSFDTSNVIRMDGMFQSCNQLTSVDLSSFDTGNVTHMGGMFKECYKLKTLDLSSFDTGNVTDMGGMFYYCFDMTAIYVGSGWSVDSTVNTEEMFVSCGVRSVTYV